MDGENDVTIKASRDIKANTQIQSLIGYTAILSNNDEPFLENEFSVFYDDLKRQKTIFLGVCAFVNHDCSPNVRYHILGKNKMIVASIKDIEKGAEVFVLYGEQYFGEGNIIIFLIQELNSLPILFQ